MDFYFKYDGECKITADTYDEAVEQVQQMLRGIYSYHQIHPICSMLSTIYEDEDGNWVLK